VYDVKWVDHDDYEILDDDLKLRWYRQRFFVQVDWDVKDENPKTEQS
jgi:hypothetical protein